MTNNQNLIKLPDIENRIFTIRGVQVMLDSHLAELYGVELRILNQAVKRNSERFPEEFMFQLNKQEWDFLRSQIVTLKTDENFEQIFDALQSKDHEPKQGIFYDGQVFDAYTFVASLVRKAQKSIILVDNYIDDTVLTLFSKWCKYTYAFSKI